MRWLFFHSPHTFPLSTDISPSVSATLSPVVQHAAGIAIVGHSTSVCKNADSVSLSLSLCLFLDWFEALSWPGYCHRCLVLLLPGCHFLTSHGAALFLIVLLFRSVRFLCVPLSKIEFQIIFTALTRLAFGGMPRLPRPTP